MARKGEWKIIFYLRASLMYSFKYNQQDATLYNIIYCCQCSTCFGRLFCPSSGAQELYTQHWVYAKLACILLVILERMNGASYVSICSLHDKFYAVSSSLILVWPLWVRIPESLPTKVVNFVVLAIVCV
jgi:hypothetical protein